MLDKEVLSSEELLSKILLASSLLSMEFKELSLLSLLEEIELL